MPAVPPAIVWPEQNPRFHWSEYAITTAALLINVFNDQLVPGTDHEVWHGGILFDDSIDRWAEKLPRGPNNAFTRAGDAALYGLVAFPFVVDALAVSLLYEESPGVSLQISLISSEPLLLSSMLNVFAKRWVTRNRPATPRCIEGEECPTGSAIHSFYSGHAAQMFAGAGTICANHLHLKLFRDPTADVATCSVALGLATLGAASRVTNRSHYTTDVIVGSTVGLLLGYLLPFLHYQHGVVAPLPGDSLGLAYVASF